MFITITQFIFTQRTAQLTAPLLDILMVIFFLCLVLSLFTSLISLMYIYAVVCFCFFHRFVSLSPSFLPICVDWNKRRWNEARNSEHAFEMKGMLLCFFFLQTCLMLGLLDKWIIINDILSSRFVANEKPKIWWNHSIFVRSLVYLIQCHCMHTSNKEPNE